MNKVVDFLLFCGTGNVALGREIATRLGVSVADAAVGKFPCGETRVELDVSVRRRTALIVQAISGSEPDRNLTELMFLIDAAQRAWADDIIPVITHFGYARQDRRVHVRGPVSARVVADAIEMRSRVRGVMVVEPHFSQLEGFFTIPFDALLPRDVMIASLLGVPGIAQAKAEGRLVVASPDVNGAARARAYSSVNGLDTRLVIVDKHRLAPGKSKVEAVVGDVEGCVAVVLDDMIDGAETMCKAGVALKEKGATAVYGCAIHAILSPPAVERIVASPLEKVVVSNAIPLREDAVACCRFEVAHLGLFIGEAIKRMLQPGGAVSALSAG